MAETIDWPPSRRPPRGRGRLVLLVVAGLLLVSGGTALSYYVDALWFDSLGVGDVFWTTLRIQSAIFCGFTLATFALLYGSFVALKPDRLGELAGLPILINGQPIRLPVEPVIRLIAIGGSFLIAVVTASAMASDWTALALYWYGGADRVRAAAGAAVDPIFGRPLTFYFFTLPAWQLISGWLLTLAVIATAVGIFFAVITGGTRLIGRRVREASTWRGLSIAFAAVLLMLAVRTYIGRFDRLFDDHTIFAGVTYTDAHVTIPGQLVLSIALAVAAVVALINAVAAPRVRWLVIGVVPAVAVYIVVGLIGWYVTSFVVKPNELVRETPYITHNIELTRQAFGLNRVARRAFPADVGIEAVEAEKNDSTLQNIRLWDWRALQDTLRQIQEIRTYYDFPDIDIDRYEIDGSVRQMMLAARELNIEKLPESSRNWINEKLIYSHGYGVTMNPVNAFTPEGLPGLVLSDMPVRSTIQSITVARPEIYFGELTNTDVYVRTRQKEFNYPQGETNSLTSYGGTGGIALGGFFRRLIIALDRGDLAKLPFSDDVNAESRLLMRRNIRERVRTLAPFLVFDDDPYIVVGEDGRLSWIIDGFTTSDSYPYARLYRLGRSRVNYMRNSVKVVIDAYDGTTTFYVFDADDPMIAGYRAIFPSLFKDASTMPPGMRKHVRYPELLLKLQASVYGLYHMTDPGAFYNREDLWTVASEVGLSAQREQAAQTMEPNFVLMTLPGEQSIEFIEILPFTPANRNNLIGWIAGRSDGPHYGTALVFDFPKTKLVDGPLQVEARIDQNPQLSGQLSLWNQQGSHVRRGAMVVIPVGRALLYAEPIYLQAERSPMPELRLVVLALQDRLAYGPTFEAAMGALFGNAPSTISLAAGVAGAESGANSGRPRTNQAAPTAAAAGGAPAAPPPGDLDSLIRGAAQDLSEYQRLTAEGRLTDAGARLEALKQKLDQLQRRR
ncbi:MAG TPA: UPF0182 family protein [Vicinamibacterales bacterium]|nr:UPF0182 family protein [Vicinamibacterales bacterium]